MDIFIEIVEMIIRVLTGSNRKCQAPVYPTFEPITPSPDGYLYQSGVESAAPTLTASTSEQGMYMEASDEERSQASQIPLVETEVRSEQPLDFDPREAMKWSLIFSSPRSQIPYTPPGLPKKYSSS